jgi:hypothetical protein
VSPPGHSRGGPATNGTRPTAENPGEKFTANDTPFDAVPSNAMLRQLSADVHALQEDESPARRWWAA